MAPNADHCNAECPIMLSVIYKPYMLNVVMLSVIMPSVVMLNVIARVNDEEKSFM